MKISNFKFLIPVLCAFMMACQTVSKEKLEAEFILDKALPTKASEIKSRIVKAENKRDALAAAELKLELDKVLSKMESNNRKKGMLAKALNISFERTEGQLSAGANRIYSNQSYLYSRTAEPMLLTNGTRAYSDMGNSSLLNGMQ